MQMRYSLAVSAVAVAVAFSMFRVDAADSFTLRKELSGKAFDWSDGGSYTNNAAPSEAGAYVEIPEGMDARLSASDAESWTFVNTYVARIRPMEASSRLVVDVDGDTATATLASEVCWNNSNEESTRNKGGIVKAGEGELVLGASGQYSYFTTVAVSNGTLTLYKEGKDTKYYFDKFVVASNATLNTIGGSGTTVCRMFFGDGVINGAGASAFQTISSDTNTSIFQGQFTGFGGNFLTVVSPVMLTGTNSTATGTLAIGATLGIKKFSAASGEASSHGAQRLMHLGTGSNPGGILYLGEGETTDVELQGRGTSAGTYSFIDAGAHGGLTLTGIYRCNAKSAAMHREVVLTGSNTTESVCAMRFIERSDDVRWCPYHIVKEGTGTWRMSVPSTVGDAPLTGGISVENGVLRYDSLKEAGVYCSLGRATYLYERYTGQLSAEKAVDWAISLGSTNGTTGTLEYAGESSVQCATRKIALKGNGRILHNSQKRIRLKGFMSDGAAAKTLTLDGIGANDNEIAGIDDSGGGALSIAKEGEGKWILGADSSFRGDLSVNGGTLEVRAPATSYTWLRFTDMQVCTNRTGANAQVATNKNFMLREMAFFDVNGLSQTIGISYTNDWRAVDPGWFAYARDSALTATADNWEKLFDDAGNSAASINLPAAPMWNDESTWMPIVIRLPEGAAAVKSFDFVWNTSSSGAGILNHPTDFKIEGSVDGFDWTELFTTNGVTSPGSGYWLYTRKSYNGTELTDAITDPSKRHTGFPLEQPVAQDYGPLDAASAAFVAPNATLKAVDGVVTLSSFGIDMATGGGRVEGFSFAENGTLSFKNVGTGESIQERSFTPVDCTGVENMSNWTIVVDGRPSSIFHADVSSGGMVRLMRPGLRIIVR